MKLENNKSHETTLDTKNQGMSCLRGVNQSCSWEAFWGMPGLSLDLKGNRLCTVYHLLSANGQKG